MVFSSQPTSSNNNANIVAGTGQQQASFMCQHLAPYSHLVDMPWLSPFIFEVLALSAGLTGLALQICNLYKTAWWLPYSEAEYPLALERIDPYVIGLAVLMTLRRVFSFFCRLAVEMARKSDRSFLRQFALSLVTLPVIAFLCLLLLCVFQLSQTYPAERFGYLLFPVVTYVILFGLNLKPLYSTGICRPYELGRSTVHVCTAVPAMCRAECSELAVDFNTRLSHLFFNSAVTVFYATVIPLFFTGHEPMFCDELWAGNVILLSYMAQFSLYCAFYLPCRYIDIMQRCAAHLGRWKRLDSPIPAS